MVSNQPQMFRLSQNQLNLLETCPRKFQHIYLEELGSPTSPEQQEKLSWGSRFHLLMQQRELGLPIESLIQEEPILQSWITSLVSAAPEILTPTSDAFRQSEHRRTLNVQGYLLTVIYDLLIADSQQAQILDWKTYPQPRNRRSLAKDWQTRLYLYVLAETSDYVPDGISMTYWFVQTPPQPQSLKFTYDAGHHEQTRQDLNRLLTQLTVWLQRYQETGEPFPQVLEALDRCDNCNYAIRCQRMRENSALNTRELVTNIADIKEVSL